MALIEVDETEYKMAEAARGLMLRAENDPRTRRKIFEILKELNPNATLPPLDQVVDGLSAKQEEALAKLAEREAERDGKMNDFLSSQKATREREAEHQKLKAKGWTSEGIERLEHHMVELGIPNYEVAANDWQARQPKDEPASPSAGYGKRSWDFSQPVEQDDGINLLFQGNKQGLDKRLKQFTDKQLRIHRETWPK